MEEERRENEINRSGSGEPAGSRTPLKGKRGSGFSLFHFLPLSKQNIRRKKREKLSLLSRTSRPEKEEEGGGDELRRGGRS